MALSPAGKPLRTCTRCSQTDDHPRHVIGVTAGGGSNFHMDCHALLGCPICVEQIKDAAGAQGEELQGHLVAKEPLSDERVAELLGQPAPADDSARRVERVVAQVSQLSDDQRAELLDRLSKEG